jgi:SNF2 family DNA or RNA helicase
MVRPTDTFFLVGPVEFKKWAPAFKLLTYFGTAKERKLKRQGWSKPNSFHVCITTYRLITQDAR